MRRLLIHCIAEGIRHAIKKSNTSGSVDPFCEEPKPRSLNGCDSFLLPKILKDFPDFDVTMAETYIKEHLKQHYSGLREFKIHNIVIAKYLPSGAQKTVVFQVAACHRQSGQLQQTRYDVNYTYLLPSASSTVASNCPNCGAALGYGAVQCAYCGSRVTSPMGSSWKVTDIIES